MIATASVQAYRNIPDLDIREKRVRNYIIENPGATANDIVRGIGMQHKNVCSRLADMSARGELIVIGRTKDALTGRQNNQYIVKESI